jgi:hypothetical protein
MDRQADIEFLEQYAQIIRDYLPLGYAPSKLAPRPADPPLIDPALKSAMRMSIRRHNKQDLRRCLNEGSVRAHQLPGECNVSNMVAETVSIPGLTRPARTPHKLFDLVIDNRTEKNLPIVYFTDPIEQAIGVLKSPAVTSTDALPPPPISLPASTPLSAALIEITRIATRFPRIARALSQGRQNSQTFAITDEYDVQRLFGALLHLAFDDIRPEEWTPTHAGKSSRMDFLLDDEEIVIEIKKTRPNLRDGDVGNELTIDIAHYVEHPRCKAFVAFIYDPDKFIKNPRALEKDLAKRSTAFPIYIFVVQDS